MKLLLLASSLDRGGAETHVCALARGLAEAGHTVEVASCGGALSRVLRQSGIVHYPADWHTHHPIRLWRAYRMLRRLLMQGKYSLVHAHGRIPAFLASVALRRSSLPLVTTVHARFRVGGWRRRFSRWGRKTIAVSEDLKQYLCEDYGLSAERIAVIPNGIDTERFSPSPTSLSEEDKLRLVFLSRMDRDCSLGAHLLCRLAPALYEQFPSLRLLLVGGGDSFSAVKREAQRANRLCKEDVVLMLGHVDTPEDILRQATGVLAVSRAALEAMACGVPTILGGDEGFLGLVDKQAVWEKAEQSNFCCRGDMRMSEAGLWEQITRLLSLSVGERSELGRTARRWVCEHHGIKRMIGQTEAFYRSVECYDPTCRGRAILCGYYGYGNMGDDALLRATIGRVRSELGDCPITALTRKGYRDEASFGVRCIRRTSFLAVRRELKEADILIYGGGTLLQDTTSFRSLLYYTALLKMAQRRGIRTELWANGLEEPHSLLGRRMIQSVLRDCATIGLRDARSVALAKELLGEGAVTAPTRQADLALETPPCDRGRLHFLRDYYGLRGVGGYAIVAVRGGVPRGYARIFQEWVAMLRAEGVTLLFVPMLPKEDLTASLRLCRSLGGRMACGLGASDFVGLASESRLVCGMRLHALVFAASAHAPFVGFGGDAKIESFCRENGGVYFTQLYH